MVYPVDCAVPMISTGFGLNRRAISVEHRTTAAAPSLIGQQS